LQTCLNGVLSRSFNERKGDLTVLDFLWRKVGIEHQMLFEKSMSNLAFMAMNGHKRMKISRLLHEGPTSGTPFKFPTLA
jgi:hypothetical protein